MSLRTKGGAIAQHLPQIIFNDAGQRIASRPTTEHLHNGTRYFKMLLGDPSTGLVYEQLVRADNLHEDSK